MLITKLWAEQPGKFFCLSTKSGAGTWKDHFFSPDKFSEIREFLRDHEDKNIYFCPHGFNRRARQKPEAVMPFMLWADLDYVDPRKIDKKLQPTIAIESSPGRYVGLWLTDEPVTEDLNRRMTYHIGCDKGGWDLTQVLRMPGTRNYKYKSQPRVRVLWDDGPSYTIKKLERLLPVLDDPEDEASGLNPKTVYEQYEGKMPRWVRRELMAKKIPRGADRSEMLWKLENALVEIGCSMNEAFVLIKRSAWNKFAGRPGEDRQLRREIEKVVAENFAEKPKGRDKLHRKSDAEEQEDEDARPQSRFAGIPMKDVKKEKLDWLWFPYLARGELSLLEGDPGLGKSYMAQMVAASVASGQMLPTNSRTQAVKAHGPVVYFDIENSAATVTKARLDDNGYVDLDNYFQEEVAFSIDDEDALEDVYEYLEEKQPALVVFDTLNTYIGKADTHKAAEVQQAFVNFKNIAKHFNCAVLCLRHLTKGQGSALYRGQGSIAFTGLARVVMSVGIDPNDHDTRVMAVTKINVTKAPQALEFRIEERKNYRSEFVWGEFVNLSAQEILDAASSARAEGKISEGLQDAMEFLEKELKGGEVDSAKLFRMAEKRSIAEKMLKRASEKLNVDRRKGSNGSSKLEFWSLPPEHYEKVSKKDLRHPDEDADHHVH